jgi:hypothetical protein
MTKHLPKLIWTLAFVLGMYFLVHGFSLSSKKDQCDANTTEKCSDSKMQSSLNIKTATRHLLDFTK